MHMKSPYLLTALNCLFIALNFALKFSLWQSQLGIYTFKYAYLLYYMHIYAFKYVYFSVHIRSYAYLCIFVLYFACLRAFKYYLTLLMRLSFI